MTTLSPPIISAIFALSENRVIGINNRLPWHLPADLQHFKKTTSGHPVIMGRKTYDSIGKPLPHRTNIILTRDPAFQVPNCLIAHSPEEALKKATALPFSSPQEIFIIGGAHIYEIMLPFISRIYMTIVHHTCDGDAYFPALNEQEWQETAREFHPADEKNAYAYSFVTLERK